MIDDDDDLTVPLFKAIDELKDDDSEVAKDLRRQLKSLLAEILDEVMHPYDNESRNHNTSQ